MDISRSRRQFSSGSPPPPHPLQHNSDGDLLSSSQPPPAPPPPNSSSLGRYSFDRQTDANARQGGHPTGYLRLPHEHYSSSGGELGGELGGEQGFCAPQEDFRLADMERSMIDNTAPGGGGYAAPDTHSYWKSSDGSDMYASRGTRYFLLKSFNAENVNTALQWSVWATTPKNEQMLTAALQTSPHVMLVFSINASSRFSGYARMKCRPGESAASSNLFVTPDGRPFWGRTFDIEWITRCELPFAECSNIRNALNDNKPVKIGRDGQEISADAGRELCELIDRRAAYGPPQRDGQRRFPSASQQFGGNRPDGGSQMKRGYGGYVPSRQPPNFQTSGNQCPPLYSRQQYTSWDEDRNDTFASRLPPSDGGGEPYGGYEDAARYEQETQAPQSRSQQQPFEAQSTANVTEVPNPVLQVFPVDLTSMRYREYKELYHSSVSEQRQHGMSTAQAM